MSCTRMRSASANSRRAASWRCFGRPTKWYFAVKRRLRGGARPRALIDGGRGDLVGRLAGDLQWLAVDEDVPTAALPGVRAPAGDDVALLQYTSDSTSAPKGVMRAIAEYRAEVAVAPNFGFDLCVARYRPEQMVGIDLSCWKLALNGAEPVRAHTLRRFSETFAPHGFSSRAMYPAYGMAEATVLISAGRRGAGPVTRTLSRAWLQRHRAVAARDEGDAQTVVGCGHALSGERIAIVD